MQKRYFFCILLLARCVCAQDAPPVDPRTLLSSLAELKQKHEQTAKTMDGKVLRDFLTAAATPNAAIALYQEAIHATAYQGEDHEQAKFNEWKRDSAEELKSDAMQIALRLHLNYLALTLQRVQGTPVSQLVPALVNHANQISGLEEDAANRDNRKRSVAQDALKKDLLRNSITDSVFAKWYGITRPLQALQDLKEWEPIPKNADGIWQKTILPQMRKDKNPQAVQYWDAKLQKEAKAATDTDLTFYIDQFNNLRKPDLLWSRAQDMLAIGQRNRAIVEMAAIVRNWPAHPSFNEWMTKLEGLLNPKDTAPAGSASASLAPNH